jgi:hypothetical protein
MIKEAEISKDGKYRYFLSRFWDEEIDPLVFCMLNPSTADAEKDDPTIRRCMGFAEREGKGGLIVVNLWALRTYDPQDLKKITDPFGPENEYYQTMALRACEGSVICAWGNHGHQTVADQLFRLNCQKLKVKMVCLGQNKNGAPKHPLYVKADQPFLQLE